MSAKHFYHTFYQTEQLFRLADDVWTLPSPPVEAPEPALMIDRAGLLDELDALLTEREHPAAVPDPVQEAESIDEAPALPTPEPAVRPMLIVPEPLPQPAPRPTVPSVRPPAAPNGRLPQLNHKVLLLADEQLDPSNLLFLEKILRAVNLNVGGVDLLNLHGAQDVDFAELLRGKYIHHFITFGVPFERINLDIMMDRYAPVRFEGITFLMADSLPTIEADQALKRRLWAALQRVFLQRYT